MSTRCGCYSETLYFKDMFSITEAVDGISMGFHIRNKVPPNIVIVSSYAVDLFRNEKSFQGIQDGYVFSRRYELGDLAEIYEDAERVGTLQWKWAIYVSSMVGKDQVVLGYKCPINHVLNSHEIKKKNFLECMFNDLDDIKCGTDEEVEQELKDMGIDTEKAKESLAAIIGKYKGVHK